jgi:phenylacetic acid degradation operon negative regulatory protein
MTPPTGPAPLTARSVLASALLGEDPPELPVAHLVHLAGLFGINGNRARVALSRMVASGEATTDGQGRYRLAGHLLERQSRQSRSRRGETRPWAGRWTMAVVTATGRSAAARAELRRRLGAARLAEQREGVWLRPDNLALHPEASAHPDLSDHPDLAVYQAVPAEDPVELAATLWDLGGWATGARHLLERMDTLEPAGPDALAPGFVLSASVLRHLQADPLLPSDLLPGDWPGSELRRTYDRWDRRYRQALTTWERSVRGARERSARGLREDPPGPASPPPGGPPVLAVPL